MPLEKRWTIAAPSPAANELAARLKTSPLLAQMLLNRGICEPADCEQFLSPTLRLLHDPALIPNLRQAAGRIAEGIRQKQRIVIYGDYDVDGITGTAILWHAIRLLGGSADYYIPHRLEEGYGLNSEAITQICDEGAQLIITVDCGITAIEQARIAAERGVDLIITDHHEWKSGSKEGRKEGEEQGCSGKPEPTVGSLLPACHTIVHPRLPSETPYPNPHLCGSGVAFKLAWAIGQEINGATRVSIPFREFLLEATALAALGTIADVVPLKGENRVLAHFGLQGLKASKLTGIRALITTAGLTGQKLDSYDVGFRLAPRINACGRMGHAREAVELLTSADEARAQEIAGELDQQNRARQAMEKAILEQAVKQCEELGYDHEDCHGIVLGAEGWHAGVIGIVASRIVSRFGRPTVMVALANGHGQGSGRSISGFHLAQALEACSAHLEGSGGHEMAAGLSLASVNFESFRAAFCDYARRTIPRELLLPELRIDAVATLRQITAALVKDMARLGPFGQGNPRPVLCCQGVEVASTPRRVGKTGDHLQFTVRQDRALMKCIAFGRGDMADRLQLGARLDLAVEPMINTWNGNTNVELEVRDLRVL